MTDPTPSPCLEVIAGPDQGTRLTLDRRETSLGRGPDVDLRLEDPTRSISSVHALIVRRGGTTHLVDKSRNGTRVRAGRRGRETAVGEEPHVLCDGEVIVMSSEVEVVFLTGEGAASPASAERGRLVAGLAAWVVVLLGLLVFLEGRDEENAGADAGPGLKRLLTALPSSDVTASSLRERALAAAWAERIGALDRARTRWAEVALGSEPYSLDLARHARRRLAALAD